MVAQATLSSSERLRLYRTRHRIEVDRSVDPFVDRCDTDGVRVFQSLSRRWWHDPNELIRLQREAVVEEVAAEASAIFRSLESESRYFQAHEDDDIALTCHEEGHRPGCAGRAGGEHEIVVGGNGGYVVTVELA